jgi:hypothetical protein
MKTKIENLRLKLALTAAPFFLTTGQTFAQRLKTSTPQQLETAVGAGTTSISNIALLICGAALAIALIVIIYKLAQGSNGAKEALIGWVVAVIVYGIAVTYVLNV